MLNISSVLCMSGSWPRNNTGLNYSEFIMAVKEKGIKTFVDCSGKNLFYVLSVNPYCIHIKNHEGFEAFNEKSPSKIAARGLENCDVADVTCGEQRLHLYYKNKQAIHANCKLDTVISAIGCGDSLMAGLLVAAKKNLNIVNTAKLSVACASTNCIREDLGMFYKRDADRLLGQVEIANLIMN